MTTTCDGEFNWIGHVVDHFRKYHVLFPLKKKEMCEVASNLIMHVFRYVGLPHIIHSDRGRGFVNNTITSVVKEWTGSCKIVHGKPRSPWVQGLVERTNACVEDMISTKPTDFNCN